MDASTHNPGTHHAEAFLSWNQVRERVGLGRSTIFMLRRRGEFPEPCRISRGRVGWKLSEVLAWMESRRPGAAA